MESVIGEKSGAQDTFNAKYFAAQITEYLCSMSTALIFHTEQEKENNSKRLVSIE